MWNNKALGDEVQLLSHVCVNGSFAHLSIDEWNPRCFPTNKENRTLSRITGFCSLINFLLGVTTNLLTLLAIPYAKYKCKYDCRYTNDWILVATVAVTRVIAVKWPSKWMDFCDKKINVFLVMGSAWVFQVLLMSPIFIQPSIGVGYNGLMGKCNYVPTGRDPIPALERYVGKPVFIGIPFLAAFLIPCLMTAISYLIIWKHMRDVKNQARERKAGDAVKYRPKMLSKTEMSFIWTVFIIFLCYFLCAIPGVLLINILGMSDPIAFLVALTFVWLQFTMNTFIYSYRIKKYKHAYQDLIALFIPCISNLKEKMKDITSTQNSTTNATANVTSNASNETYNSIKRNL